MDSYLATQVILDGFQIGPRVHCNEMANAFPLLGHCIGKVFIIPRATGSCSGAANELSSETTKRVQQACRLGIPRRRRRYPEMRHVHFAAHRKFDAFS